MILNLLKLFHSLCAAVSLCAGPVALSRIFAGRPFERSTTIFLESALAASIAGLLLHIQHGFQPIRLMAMTAIYVSGVAVLAWKRFHLSQGWGLVFTLSLMAILCLDVLIAVRHLFDLVSIFDAAVERPPKLTFLITESVVALFFASMGIVATKRYRITSQIDGPRSPLLPQDRGAHSLK
jgi:cytochrome c biogenesis factor